MRARATTLRQSAGKGVRSDERGDDLQTEVGRIEYAKRPAPPADSDHVSQGDRDGTGESGPAARDRTDRIDFRRRACTRDVVPARLAPGRHDEPVLQIAAGRDADGRAKRR